MGKNAVDPKISHQMMVIEKKIFLVFKTKNSMYLIKVLYIFCRMFLRNRLILETLITPLLLELTLLNKKKILWNNYKKICKGKRPNIYKFISRF